MLTLIYPPISISRYNHTSFLIIYGRTCQRRCFCVMFHMRKRLSLSSRTEDLVKPIMVAFLSSLLSCSRVIQYLPIFLFYFYKAEYKGKLVRIHRFRVYVNKQNFNACPLRWSVITIYYIMSTRNCFVFTQETDFGSKRAPRQGDNVETFTRKNRNN